MIPYSSCMCFGAGTGNPQRRHGDQRWRLVTCGLQGEAKIVLGRNEDNTYCIRVVERKDEEEVELEARKKRKIRNLTKSETCLLEAIEREKRVSHSATGFIPVYKRRTRQPIIPLSSCRQPILDDAYGGITQVLLSHCGRWAFNTFNLDMSTGGRPLSVLLVHLFQGYGFINTFRLDPVKVWRCFNVIEAAYHSHNPYHNSVHAADVTQAMHCFLSEKKISDHLTPLEAMASLIAAVGHDLDHPGVNQSFLVSTSNYLVDLYKNSSVLENHHWRTAIACLLGSGIFDHLEKHVWQEIQSHIRSLILATDITRQKDFLARFRGYLDSKALDMKDKQYRHFALQISLKCADLCNPCRPWPISQQWSYQVCQEFYRQGAYERQLNLPQSITFDSNRTSVAKIQADFFQFVVSPLFEIWNRFLDSPLSHTLVKNLHHNHFQWRQTVKQAIDAESSSIAPLLRRAETNSKTYYSHISERTSQNRAAFFHATSRDPVSISSLQRRTVIQQQLKKEDSKTSLICPQNISMEIYATEELNPQTTLLSLSSNSDTVHLRKLHITTKIKSHLVCPPLFHPLHKVQKNHSPSSTENRLPLVSQSNSSEKKEDSKPAEKEENGGCEVKEDNSSKSDCPNGCCSPKTNPRVNPPSVLKQLQQSLGQSDNAENHQTRSDPVSLQQHTSALFQALASPNKGWKTNQPRLDRTACGREQQSVNPESPTKGKLAESTRSWCWEISRSLSEERPHHSSLHLGSPVPSWQGSATSLSGTGRRGSAPVTTEESHWPSLGEIVDSRGGLRGGSESRRWSVPTEPISEKLPTVDSVMVRSSLSQTTGNKELVRRHSFGLLEPFFAVTSSESENDGSSTGPTSTGTTCSTRRNSTVPTEPSRQSYTAQVAVDLQDTEESFDTSESFIPCFQASPPREGRRRGSLPAEIPIALMCHVPPVGNSPRLLSRSSFEERPPRGDPQRTALPSDHPRVPSASGDFLGVLIGPARVWPRLHSIGVVSENLDRAQLTAQGLPRRRSGGLELLSGLWRSRTTAETYQTPQQVLSVAGRLKIPRQKPCSLDSVGLYGGVRGEDTRRRCSNLINNSPNRTSGISAISEHLLCQPRRGSFPLDLLSLSSCNTSSGDHGD